VDNGGGDGISCFEIKIGADTAKFTNARIAGFGECKPGISLSGLDMYIQQYYDICLLRIVSYKQNVEKMSAYVRLKRVNNANSKAFIVKTHSVLGLLLLAAWIGVRRSKNNFNIRPSFVASHPTARLRCYNEHIE